MAKLITLPQLLESLARVEKEIAEVVEATSEALEEMETGQSLTDAEITEIYTELYPNS